MKYAMSDIHMNFTVDFSLLTANLTGAAEINETGVEFLVMPQQQNTGSENLPLNGVVDGINAFFEKMTESTEFKLNYNDIFERIKKFVSEIALEALKFSIKQVFIHLIKPKDGKVQLEYAFSIGIDFSNEKNQFDFPYAQLQSAAFGIWNTKNKKIIAEMGLLDISEQLE